MNDDCSSAFICARAEDEAGTSVGSTLNCGDLVMHFLFNYPLRYTCEGPDSGYECPGSYHFGCEGGDIGELTTSPTTTTPGTTTQGGDGQTTTTTTTQGGGGDTTTTTTQGGTTTDTMPGSTQPSGSGLLMASTLLSVLALLPLIIS